MNDTKRIYMIYISDMNRLGAEVIYAVIEFYFFLN